MPRENDHPPFSFESTSSLTEFFAEELDNELARLGLDVNDETRAYLTHLLDDWTRLTPAQEQELGFQRPAALMLSDALEARPGTRIEAYRKLGDACLYNCGFFRARLTRRSISASYYEQMGQGAYHRVADLLAWQSNALGQLFVELARSFEGLVRALRRLANRASGHHIDGELLSRIKRGEQVDPDELLAAGYLLCSTPAQS